MLLSKVPWISQDGLPPRTRASTLRRRSQLAETSSRLCNSSDSEELLDIQQDLVSFTSSGSPCPFYSRNTSLIMPARALPPTAPSLAMSLSFTVTDFVRSLGVQDDSDDWRAPRTPEDGQHLRAMSKEINAAKHESEHAHRNFLVGSTTRSARHGHLLMSVGWPRPNWLVCTCRRSCARCPPRKVQTFFSIVNFSFSSACQGTTGGSSGLDRPQVQRCATGCWPGCESRSRHSTTSVTLPSAALYLAEAASY